MKNAYIDHEQLIQILVGAVSVGLADYSVLSGIKQEEAPEDVGPSKKFIPPNVDLEQLFNLGIQSFVATRRQAAILLINDSNKQPTIADRFKDCLKNLRKRLTLHDVIYIMNYDVMECTKAMGSVLNPYGMPMYYN